MNHFQHMADRVSDSPFKCPETLWFQAILIVDPSFLCIMTTSFCKTMCSQIALSIFPIKTNHWCKSDLCSDGGHHPQQQKGQRASIKTLENTILILHEGFHWQHSLLLNMFKFRAWLRNTRRRLRRQVRALPFTEHLMYIYSMHELIKQSLYLEFIVSCFGLKHLLNA